MARSGFSRLFFKASSAEGRSVSRLTNPELPPPTITTGELTTVLTTPISPALSTRDPEQLSSPPELRRTDVGYLDLRAVAENQINYVSRSEWPDPHETTDRHDSHKVELDEDRFHDKDDVGGYSDNDKDDYDSYDDLKILSDYCEEGSDDATMGGVAEFRYVEAYDRRSMACSDESDWFADTKSFDHRLKRFRQRCYQVVEYPGWPEGSLWGQDVNELVSGSRWYHQHADHFQMLATVIHGPGRPKLIQIQHPPPASPSKSVSPGSSCPRTPEQRRNEVSAFSPYDTPPRRTDILEGFEKIPTYRRTSLVPAPLCFATPPKRERADSGIFMPSETKLEQPRHPISQHGRTWSSLTGTESLPETLEHDKMNLNIEAVAEAIDFCTENALLLTSPLLFGLGHRSQNDKKQLLCLQKIFPSTPESLLSSLAAWLIVDLYFLKTRATQPSSSCRKFAFMPEKARATLAITASSVSYYDYRSNPRAEAVHASVGVMGQRLMTAIRGTFDADLWKSLRVLVEVVESSRA